MKDGRWRGVFTRREARGESKLKMITPTPMGTAMLTGFLSASVSNVPNLAQRSDLNMMIDPTPSPMGTAVLTRGASANHVARLSHAT